MDTIARQLDAARHQFKTTYSRQGMEANIVHIGFGAFHRGHQAVYNDLTNEITGNRWGIFELNLFGDAELVDALNAQEGLFQWWKRQPAPSIVAWFVPSPARCIRRSQVFRRRSRS